MKRIFALFLIAAVYLGVFCACAAPEVENNTEGLVIAVSIVPEEAFVKAVCGDLVKTVVMVPPGSSPENYEPTPMQMEEFSDAVIYFSIGITTEKNNILPSVNEKTKIVSLADVCAVEYDDRFIGSERDPHIWLSPKRAVVMVNTIAEEMSALDKANAETYKNNAKAYIEEINAADTDIEAVLEKLSFKKFIVFHPAFGYLADDYGLEMYALEEEGKESTAAHMQEMIDLAKREGIKVIFYQAEADSSQSKAFAEEIGGVTAQLEPLSGDYINNLKTMANTLSEAISGYDEQ